ncbi:WbqC family protein [Fodinibius saliphilus]|uniref:WbqC family protein n=1 Tax=Fodinibius saliphilus TaxID=1920650 RepID=UPI001FE63876|nr:WbqC family protein [Fodinibius saliphilus]
MQPYFFPYVGYFQLVKAVDTFIFYDDVNFIKRGWINRNNILLQGNKYLFSIPCVKPSQNDLIKDTEVNYGHPNLRKIKKTFYHAYNNKERFEEIQAIFEKVLSSKNRTIADMAMESVQQVAEYLNLDTDFKVSSQEYPENRELDKAERLIDISQKEGADTYINAIGGKELYDKGHFAEKGIQLYFLEPVLTPYKQSSDEFISGLSILDLLMHLSKEDVNKKLDDFTLL